MSSAYLVIEAFECTAAVFGELLIFLYPYDTPSACKAAIDSFPR